MYCEERHAQMHSKRAVQIRLLFMAWTSFDREETGMNTRGHETIVPDVSKETEYSADLYLR